MKLQKDLKNLHSEGKYSEAMDLAEDIKAKVRAEFGDHNPVYASAVNNVALMQKMMGHYEESVASYTEAVQLYKEVAGSEHPSYRTALSNLGLAYKSQADASKGVERLSLLERSTEALGDVLDLQKASLESEDPNIAVTMTHLGSVQLQLKKYQDAEKNLRDAVQRLESAYGAEHLSVALAKNNLGFFLKSTKAFDEAEKLYLSAHEIRAGQLGPSHPDSIITKNNLAELYRSLGNDSQANLYQSEILSALEETK